MRRALLILGVTLLAGCGIQSRPFPEADNELGNRPGLLTGQTGAYTMTCCGANATATPPAQGPRP